MAIIQPNPMPDNPDDRELSPDAARDALEEACARQLRILDAAGHVSFHLEESNVLNLGVSRLIDEAEVAGRLKLSALTDVFGYAKVHRWLVSMAEGEGVTL